MTSTPAPWAPDTPGLLTRSLTHLATVTLNTAAGDTFDLDLIDGRVTFDERSAPRVQGTLTCRVPTDPALILRVDPRARARVTVSAGYRRPDGSQDVHQLADLGLRNRPVRRPDDRMTLTVHSDESLVIDGATSTGGTLSETNTLNAIATVIRLPLPGAVVDYTGLSNAGPAVNQSMMDVDKWDVIADLADRIGAKVYDRGDRTWRVTDVATIGASALTVAPGAGGTLIESEADLSRDDWANWVVLRYVWTDASNVRQRVVGSRRITTGPYAAVAPNIKFYEEDRDTPTTQAQADAAAASLVARMVTRGRSLTISTIAAYWLRPGDTISVQLPTGDPETHLVASVAFDLATGRMTVTTRLPDNTATIGA